MLNKYYPFIKNYSPFILLAILIFLNVIFSLFFPVYPDEINWRVIYSRILSFDYISQTYLLACGDTNLKVNIYLFPFLKIFDFFSNPNLINLRLIPLASYTFFIFQIFLILYKRFLQNKSIFILLVSISSLILFTSSTFVWNSNSRPEFIIYILLSLCLIYICKEIYLIKGKKNIFMFLIIFLWLLSCTAHPKFLYFLPLIIFLIAISKFNFFYNIFYLFILIFYIFLIVDFHSNVIFPENCLTNFRDFLLWMKSFSINVFDFFKNPKSFIYEFYINIPRHFHSILNDGGVNHFIYSSNPRGNFLPALQSNLIISLTNIFISFLFYLVLFLSGSLVFFNTLKFMTLNKLNQFIYLTLICTFILLLLNRTTNYYDVNLWIKLMMACLLLYYANNKSYFKNFFYIHRKWITYLNIIFLTILSFSTVIIYEKYFTSYKASSHWYHMSTPIKYYFQKHKKNIANHFNNNCSDNNSDYILFDDHTYSVFSNKKNTYPISYTAYPFFWDGKDNQEALNNFFVAKKKKIIIYSSCDFDYMIDNNIFKMKNKYEKYNLCCYKNY